MHLAAGEVSGPAKIIELLLEARAMTEAKDLGGWEPQSSSHGAYVFAEFSNDTDFLFHLKGYIFDSSMCTLQGGLHIIQ